MVGAISLTAGIGEPHPHQLQTSRIGSDSQRRIPFEKCQSANAVLCRHSAWLRKKVIVYKHLEHWDIVDQALISEEVTPRPVAIAS